MELILPYFLSAYSIRIKLRPPRISESHKNSIFALSGIRFLNIHSPLSISSKQNSKGPQCKAYLPYF